MLQNRSLLVRRMLVWSVGAAVCIPAALHMIDVGRILYSRIDYPYDVHWMDGATLLHTHRLLHGEPIYPKIAADAGFLPNVYPPFLYFVLAAAGSLFGGLDYSTGRLVSIAATGLLAALLAREVYLRFRGLPLPLVASVVTLGAIAAGFPAIGGWYDATMPDPLALCLSVVSCCLIRSESTRFREARLGFASLAMVLTVYTKQSYLILVLWQILFLVRSNPRHALVVGATMGGLSCALLLLAQYVTRGGFLEVVGFGVLRQSVDWARVVRGAVLVVVYAPYLVLAVPAGVFLALRRSLSPAATLWIGMVVFAVPMALGHYAKIGGWDNNFMPIVVLGPAASMCVLADLCALGNQRTRAIVLAASAVSACALLIWRRYPMEPLVAHAAQRDAARRLNDFVSGLGPRVLIPARPFLAIRNGSRIEQMHIMGWFDASAAGHEDLHFDGFIRRTRPDYVILTNQEPSILVEPLARDYVLQGLVPKTVWKAQTLEAMEVNQNPRAPLYPGQLQWILERFRGDPPGIRCLFDFESGSYAGWTGNGAAFANGPSLVDSQNGTKDFAISSTVVGVVGNAYATSGQAGNAATGTLVSDEFVIDRDDLELHLGGGASSRTRVEVRVEGSTRHKASGLGNNFMRIVRFNVARDRGKTARVVAIDDDSNGHVLLDHVCLVEAPPRDTTSQ